MAFGAFQSSAPPGAPVASAQVQRKSPVALWLLLPGVLYLVLFFVTPLFSLVITSFEEPVPGGFMGEFQTGFRWENYVEVVSTYFPISVGHSSMPVLPPFLPCSWAIPSPM